VPFNPFPRLSKWLASSAIILGALVIATTASATTIIRLAHTLNPTDARHLAAKHFGALVEQRSAGAIKVEVFPSSQLGGQVEIFEGLKLGTIEMNIAGSTHLANLIPTFGLFDLPYLAPDVKSFIALLDGDVGQTLLDRLPRVGMRGLAYSEVGFRHIYTRAPVTSMSDLKGRTIRIPGNAIYSDTMSAFGARPTPMAIAEIFTALQQGAIGGAENLIPYYRNSGHFEVARHLALTYHAALPSVVIVSDVFWSRLTPEQRTLIKDAAKEAALHERKLTDELSVKALADLPGLGVTIHRPDLKPFRDAAAKIYDKHANKIGADVIQTVRAAFH
jgi:tripartite ATP-independent transporter DctP family solute receptor